MMELKPEFIAYTHFGISSSDLLKIVKEKMVLWSDLAVDAVKIGGVEELHKLLLAEDDDYRELFNLTKNSRIISGFHMMTLLGLIDYASRRKERRE
jgi:tartrate dehydratase beta subunit/fumarate hydratase class I family protein